MDNKQITAAATALGIRPTRATVGSHLWECWADRVREAQALAVSAQFADYGRIDAETRRDHAMAEANADLSTDAKFDVLRAALG
jgi:trans-2-enoyl-CoA reductase